MTADRPFSDISYQQFLDEEKLMGSKCKGCGRLYLPPRSFCSQCESDDLEWTEAGGRGKLIAFTSIAIGPPSMVEQGYNAENPYVIGVVELEEKARIVARIEGVSSLQPQKIKIGTSLLVGFSHQDAGGEKKTFLVFRPK